jgi:hypothetical protein
MGLFFTRRFFFTKDENLSYLILNIYKRSLIGFWTCDLSHERVIFDVGPKTDSHFLH